MISIETNSRSVLDALRTLGAAAANPGPALKEIGEDLARDAKLGFGTSTGPDGKRWAPNAQSTYVAYLASRTGTARKDGRINAKGAALAANKRPLIDSRELADTIGYRVDGNTLTVYSPRHFGAKTAAIHQFGGKAGRDLKTTIPARPFLPVTTDGALYPKAERTVLEVLTRHLLRRAK